MAKRNVAVNEFSVFERAIERSRFDPIWFAREILQMKTLDGEKPFEDDPMGSWELDQWQEELLEACADVVRKVYLKPRKLNMNGTPLITVRACQGPGKTFGAALIMHWFGFCFPALQICTAPKLQQVTTRLWREFAKIRARAIEGYHDLHEVRGTQIEWRVNQPKFARQWMAVAETGRSPESLQGFHSKYLLAIIDEASGVPDEMVAVIRGAMSTGKVVLGLLIGNPTKTTGAFADSHRRAELAGDYYRMAVPYTKSRRVSRDWVAQMERQYGKKSPVYIVRCLGDFSETMAGQLISMEWIVEARNRVVDPIRGDGSQGRLRVSVDCAAGGDDETVCCVTRHFDAFRVGLRMTRHSFELAQASKQTATAAEELFNAFGGIKGQDDFVVDSLGVGVGAAGELIARGHRVVTYQGGAASADPARWRNRRVQSYLSLRNDLRDGTLTLQEDFLEGTSWTDLEGQLCSIRSVPAVERLEDLQTRQQMKDDGLESPDMADALAMQYATQTPQTLTAAVARRHEALGERARPTMHVVHSTINSGLDGL